MWSLTLEDLALDLQQVIDTVDDPQARARLVLIANAMRNLAATSERRHRSA